MSSKRKRWTKKEFDILDKNFNEEKELLLSLLPDRTWRAVMNKIRSRDLPRNGTYKRYTEEEDEILRNNYHLPEEELKLKLKNRSWESIIYRCNVLELDREKSWNLWTDEEESILKVVNSVKEAMSLLPNRNSDMIKSKMGKMGLKVIDDRVWSDSEDKYLKDNYEKIDDVNHICEYLGRTLTSVYVRANRLGLYRGNEDKTISSQEIATLYNSGMHMNKISRILSISPHTVRDRLEGVGIEVEHFIPIGPNSPAWKGGLTSKNMILRGRREYREWRDSVYNRDNYTCQRCGDNKGGNLHAHHIVNFSSNPKLRYDIDNGITLCKNCHINSKDSFHVKYGTKNNNLEQLMEHIESYAVEEM